MNEILVTMVGNLTADPELKLVGDGVSRTRLRLAVNRRRRDRDTNQWVDGEAVFFDATCWRQTADNVAASLSKGDRVLVHGRIVQREYEATDGVTRRITELEAYQVAADLSYATVSVRKPRREQVPPPDDAWGVPAARQADDPTVGDIGGSVEAAA